MDEWRNNSNRDYKANGKLKFDADTLSVALRGAKLVVLADPTNGALNG